MCIHSVVKFRWAMKDGKKQIAVYCKDCDKFLRWGKKVAGEKSPVQQKLF